MKSWAVKVKHPKMLSTLYRQSQTKTYFPSKHTVCAANSLIELRFTDVKERKGKYSDVGLFSPICLCFASQRTYLAPSSSQLASLCEHSGSWSFPSCSRVCFHHRTKQKMHRQPLVQKCNTQYFSYVPFISCNVKAFVSAVNSTMFLTELPCVAYFLSCTF